MRWKGGRILDHGPEWLRKPTDRVAVIGN